MSVTRRDIVAASGERDGNAAAATVYRQNVIVRTVRDEDAGLAVDSAAYYKAG